MNSSRLLVFACRCLLLPVATVMTCRVARGAAVPSSGWESFSAPSPPSLDFPSVEKESRSEPAGRPGGATGSTSIAGHSSASWMLAIQQRYSPLYVQLGLSRNQRRMFEVLLTERIASGQHRIDAALAQGMPVDRVFREIIYDRTRNETLAEIERILGANLAAAYEWFEQTSVVRSLVGAFQQALGGPAARLTSQQRELLIDRIAEVSRDADGWVSVEAVKPEVVAKAVETLLSFEQRQVLERVVSQWVADRAAETGRAAP